MRPAASLLSLALFLAACDDGRRVPPGPPGTARDAGTTRDAGSNSDAEPIADVPAPRDAEGLDAPSAPRDTGTDGGLPGRDAQLRDAEPTDAGNPPARYSGSVIFSQSLAGIGDTPSWLLSLSAGFQATTAPTCTIEARGACTLYRCPTGATTTTMLDAGPITATVGARTLTTLFSAANGRYDPEVRMQASWNPGETIRFSAGGGQLPAFSTSLVAPGIVTLLSPTLPLPPTAFVLDRARDLQLDWTTTGDAEVVATVSSYTASTGRSVIVQCVFPSSQRAATVPSAALTALASGTGAFSVSTRALAQLRVSDVDLYVQAFGSGVAGFDSAARSVELR